MLLERGYNVTCLDRLFFGKEPIADILNHPRFKVVRDISDGLTQTYILKDVDIVLIWQPYPMTLLANLILQRL
jgi:hypothetical protein